MPESLLSKSPIFVPKPQDSDITNLGLKFPATMMDATIVRWRPDAAARIATSSELFIVNPVTHFLLYKDSKELKSFKKLPYPHGIRFEDLHGNPELRSEKLIRPAIEFQLAKNSGIVIAPFFFTEDDNGAKFNLNLTMLSESIRHFQSQKIQKPLFSMIYIGNAILTNSSAIINVVDRYTDEMYQKAVSGYVVAIDNFDAKRMSVESLCGLAKLVFLLSLGNKPVFVKSIGTFGEVLGAIGAAGFVGDKETMSVEYLQERPKFFGRPKNWVYLPEMLDHANEAEVRKIGYKCPCPACGGGIAMDATSRKRHLLYSRIKAMDELSKRIPDKRIDYMKNRLGQAVDFVDYCVRKHRSPFEKTRLALVKWGQVLDFAKTLKRAEKDSSFEKALLADLDSKTA